MMTPSDWMLPCTGPDGCYYSICSVGHPLLPFPLCYCRFPVCHLLIISIKGGQYCTLFTASQLLAVYSCEHRQCTVTLISKLMHKILIYLHIIHLLKSSTCFEHYSAHLQEVYVVTVYMQPLVSSLSAGDCPVHRLTLRVLMSYIYGAPILDVSRSHTTTQHSR